jgi:SAM-dependent methyltransferase
MNPELLRILRCPACGSELHLEGDTVSCTACAAQYPIVDGIPRFVEPENYASNFGFQWNRFRRTQLDSTTGVPISRDRFLAQTGWTEETLRGKRVLDAGCGAGRFAEIALSLGAEVVAIDYSSAVDAASKNLQPHPRLHIVQADIYRLPFAPESFDFVYSLGVLQHTPDVHRAVLSLIPMIARGGGLTVDLYFRRRSSWFEPKYWLRPITTRMPQQTLFAVVERATPPLLAISRAVSRVPLIGRVLRRLVPVANYEGIFPLTPTQLREWAVLDTFDWFGPRFDQPQTAETLQRWLIGAGLEHVQVARIHHLTGRGSKPAGTSA